mgnify:CR=1 FL=1
MIKNGIPNIIGIGALQRKASEVIEKIEKSGEEGFVASHNKIRVVIINLSQYKEFTAFREATKKEEDEILEIVAQGNREYKEGTTIKKKTLKELMKQHGDR